MIKILDGKELRDRLLEHTKESIAKNDLKLKLAVVTVGNDDASKVYVNNKRKACEKVGIEFKQVHINNEGLDTHDLFDKVQRTILYLNVDDSVTGIIVQSPIKGLEKYEDQVFNLIVKHKDVDAFGDEHIIDLYRNQSYIISCTPSGIMRLLDDNNIEVEGKNVVIIGRSNIVGKPLALKM